MNVYMPLADVSPSPTPINVTVSIPPISIPSDTALDNYTMALANYTRDLAIGTGVLALFTIALAVIGFLALRRQGQEIAHTETQLGLSQAELQATQGQLQLAREQFTHAQDVARQEANDRRDDLKRADDQRRVDYERTLEQRAADLSEDRRQRREDYERENTPILAILVDEDRPPGINDKTAVADCTLVASGNGVAYNVIVNFWVGPQGPTNLPSIQVFRTMTAPATRPIKLTWTIADQRQWITIELRFLSMFRKPIGYRQTGFVETKQGVVLTEPPQFFEGSDPGPAA